MKNEPKGISTIYILVFIALLIGIGVYVYSLVVSSSKPEVKTDKTIEPVKTIVFDDSDMRIPMNSSSTPSPSAIAFTSKSLEKISTTDAELINKYFSTYSVKSLPSIAQAQKMLKTYPKLISVFNANYDKTYQCSIISGNTCNLGPIRDSVHLMAIKFALDMQQKNTKLAKTDSANIVTFGKNISKNSEDVITLLIGWSTQSLGYSMLSSTRANASTSILLSTDKDTLIAQLRQEHKNVIKNMYMNSIEGIDYITSASNTPTGVVSPEDEDVVREYRKLAATVPYAWNPSETKKYFYDSHKKSISNIDLPCGSNLAENKINLDFDPNDKNTENYGGKTFYSTTYASFENLNEKRCIVEGLISSL